MMGRYCACGVKMRLEGWKCECEWEGWYLCFRNNNFPEIPIKEHPDCDGKYLVRTFDCDDYNEIESEFCLTPKNWGQITNEAISRWEAEYQDGWMGYTGVYAWKDIL